MGESSRNFNKISKFLSLVFLSAIFVYASFFILLSDLALAQEAVTKQQPRAESVTATGEKPSDIIRQIAQLVQDMQRNLEGVARCDLYRVRGKKIDIKQYQKMYNEVIRGIDKYHENYKGIDLDKLSSRLKEEFGEE